MVHQIQHRQQQERFMRGFALGGFGSRRVGGAVEGGKVFDGGGEISHRFFQAVIQFVSS